MPGDPTDSSTSFSDGCSSSANRSDMVEAARQFMSTPKVRNTPFEEQKKFLLEKGLTEAEIQEAVKMLPPPDPSTSATVLPYPQNQQQQQQIYYQQQPPPQSFGGKLYSFTQSMVVIGGASYMAYKVMRTWVLPKFFNIPEPGNEKLEYLQNQVNELQNSTKFIMDSVEQTLQTVSAQQEQLNRALLLMSNNNGGTKTAAANSTTTNGVLKQPKTVRWQTNSIPSWQLAENGLNGNGKHANGKHQNGGENGDEDEKQEDEEFLEAQNYST
uniref:Peroxisomal membrane protein PEX14 n=1 Tax=Panagrolaimus sp. ES5 TaxID=591445 RepID=A0AC34FZ91_9BILA